MWKWPCPSQVNFHLGAPCSSTHKSFLFLRSVPDVTEPQHHPVFVALGVEQGHCARVGVELLQIHQTVLGQDRLAPHATDIVLAARYQHVRHRTTANRERHLIQSKNETMAPYSAESENMYCNNDIELESYYAEPQGCKFFIRFKSLGKHTRAGKSGVMFKITPNRR